MRLTSLRLDGPYIQQDWYWFPKIVKMNRLTILKWLNVWTAVYWRRSQ